MADDRRIDPWLAVAMLAGLAVRWLPLVVWGIGRCVRDECSYRVLAVGITEGAGLQPHEGWLWAPGYPYLLAAVHELTGSVMTVKWLQGACGALSVALVYAIALRVGDRRGARTAAWLLALHPTVAWFATTLWSEAIYSFLLLGAVLGLLWSRDGSWRRAVLPGLLVGVCVLFRGVATYMAPVFALAAVWPAAGGLLRGELARRWRHAAALLLATVIVVAPYSVSTSLRHGGLLISDATLGQMMYLGNNDFPPVTFDYGNGLNRRRVMQMYTRGGRAHCDDALPPPAWDRCEVAGGREWIRQHPAEFVARVPVRLAQLLNPHSFLTRHVRWGKWPGLPWAVKEGLGLAVVGMSLLVILGGTVGAWARARGPYGVLAVGIVLYHLAAIALLAGLTRYRLPLEPLWLVYAASLLAAPRATLGALRASPWRAVGCAVSLVVLLPLVFWLLPTGFPSWL